MRGFSVISNNCWSNKLYEQLGMIYTTPFINIFFHPDDYLKMLHGLKCYLALPLSFAKESRHDNINRLRKGHKTLYPIALLGDVELQCLHFASEPEVTATWNRRLARMMPDESRWFFKFSDEYGCTQAQLEQFDALPFMHKVCFTCRPMPHLKSAVHVPGDGDNVTFQDQTDPKWFNAVRWIE